MHIYTEFSHFFHLHFLLMDFIFSQNWSCSRENHDINIIAENHEIMYSSFIKSRNQFQPAINLITGGTHAT